MLAQLSDEDVDKVINFMDGIQYAEVESEKDAQELVEVNSEDLDSVEIDNNKFLSQIATEDYDDMFDGVADMLAEISSEDKEKLESLVAQVKAGKYNDEGEILLAQGDGTVSKNEELDAVAEFMAQLNNEQTEKINKLAETKKQEFAQLEKESGEEKQLAQTYGNDISSDYDEALF